MKSWDTKKFIEEASKIHGDRYNYSKTNYINYHKKVEIICPYHGIFSQLAQNHISGKGCKKCKGYLVFNTNDFIQKAKKIHGDKYDYSNSVYKSNRNKVEIMCKIHGKFDQLANSHLKGRGCSKCGKINSQILQKRNTLNDFIQKAKKIHKNLYDYSDVKYIQTHKKIIIKCKYHGEFLQTPHNHISLKQGCPICFHNISKSETQFLDYLNIKDRNLYIKPYRVDGYNKETNTIYEFLGDYYHGNPNIFNLNDINKTCKKTFGELYNNTFKKLNDLKNRGYEVKYIWESDWKRHKKEDILNLIIKL
jgi:hypothetical protein